MKRQALHEEDYRSASDKIYKLSREGKQADAANLMIEAIL